MRQRFLEAIIDNPPDNEHPLSSGVAGAALPVQVWDLPVRIFHWLLVLLLVAQVITGTVGGGDMMVWHMRGGYAVLALVLFRIAWGFAGSHHARFASFVRAPAAAMRYARSLVRPPHHPHAGHNPLGAWMVVLMLVLLLAQVVLGLFANDDSSTEGPWAKFITQDRSNLMRSLHGDLAWIIVALAAVHVAAVLYYLVRLKQNLVTPMITGVKAIRTPVPKVPGRASVPLAAVIFAACAALVWWLVTRL